MITSIYTILGVWFWQMHSHSHSHSLPNQSNTLKLSSFTFRFRFRFKNPITKAVHLCLKCRGDLGTAWDVASSSSRWSRLSRSAGPHCTGGSGRASSSEIPIIHVRFASAIVLLPCPSSRSLRVRFASLWIFSLDFVLLAFYLYCLVSDFELN